MVYGILANVCRIYQLSSSEFLNFSFFLGKKMTIIFVYHRIIHVWKRNNLWNLNNTKKQVFFNNKKWPAGPQKKKFEIQTIFFFSFAFFIFYYREKKTTMRAVFETESCFCLLFKWICICHLPKDKQQLQQHRRWRWWTKNRIEI